VALEARGSLEPLLERDRQEEAEQDLDARRGDADLLQQLE
jgi:hypothetical protein